MIGLSNNCEIELRRNKIISSKPAKLFINWDISCIALPLFAMGLWGARRDRASAGLGTELFHFSLMLFNFILQGHLWSLMLLLHIRN